MKFSIIVPVYNVEDYLRECVESILGQTHKDVELVLVNDGSTDGSPQICEQYAAQYPDQIKVLHTENKGPLYARIIASEIATGDILMFVDSDDCLRQDALACVARCMEEQSCDMVLFNTGKWDVFPTRQVPQDLEVGAVFEGHSKKEAYKKIVLGQIPNSLCLKAVKATCAEVPQRFLQYNAKHGEDLLHSVQLLTNCKKIVYLNEDLYYYRDRPGSSICLFSAQRNESAKVVRTELDQYIDQWGMPELLPLNNVRKVNSWIEHLKALIKSREQIGKNAYKQEMLAMAKDPYFRSAYVNMDRSLISRRNRFLAWCLYWKQCHLITWMYATKETIGK